MRDLPITRRHAALAAAGVLVVLVLGGKLMAHRSGAAVPPIPTATDAGAPAAASPSRLVVDVVGAVRRPGLYRLARGARIADAVLRAGGVTPKAALDAVNLAAPVADGEQVVVPRRGTVAAAAGGGAGAGGAGAGPSAGPVQLSTATLEQLDALPGIGPVTAQKILSYREQHGAFGSVEELDAVPGIGPARLEQLKGLVVP